MALRNAFEGLSVESKQDIEIARLDTLLRRTDPLAAGANMIGYVGNALLLELDAGRVFAVGGEQVTTIAANASLLLENPTGSGKNVYIISWSIYADAAASVRYHLDAVSTGAILTPENLNLDFNGGASPINSVVIARMGAGVLSGGRIFNVAHRVNSQSPVEKSVLVKLPPGRSVAIQFVSSSATNTVDFNFQWMERNI